MEHMRSPPERLPSIDDDPTIKELFYATPQGKALNAAGDDSNAIMNAVRTSSGSEWDKVDSDAIIMRVRTMDEAQWPIVEIAGRYGTELFAYYGKAAMDLRRSEVIKWIRMRLKVPAEVGG
jgi:hypothetical protein